ncbi:alpha/beta hydrolase-fold protein [Microbacterium sp. zg.Y1090]|uniref:alpha/beta hydrolase n=1 Tax=Microbacterium TaxID=33882 RepID=UPI00214D0635|nr:MULTISPECIES: alpha/beta hydrolase-fold protein [unclassified Microbacterium]MCR2813789.1 alpha/beta hydrolase-fold protein [Microbacterium sp. zg.Y1084]MCR2819697.1 alpha/beta hydrolase-fold protein [Microbacterium sp. zg.Y1090]MDL5487545.1 alpha/beta hydrolase-fold protein [Microbacterium sp. zg-Y1211]WIM28059.1 alpha/beta hydrolase-fold protein [Microbacterium sp. zg-Y1090]
MVAVPALDPDAVRWSAPPAERAGRPLLVMLHGYGADEHDLFAFAPHLPADFVVAAVRAPLLPPFPTPGYSWYPIEGLQSRRPEDVTAAAERLVQWLDAETDAASVGLLGFSQGASVALQAMRLQPDLVSFAVNLSGYVAPGALPGDAHLAELRPPVFWGRGTHDDVIPLAQIEHTVQWLPEHVDLSGRVYTGLAHSVSQEELDDVVTFLRKRLEAAAQSPS